MEPSAYVLKGSLPPPSNYSAPGGKTLFWQSLAASYQYLSESSPFIQCAQQRWLNRSADCMPEVAVKRYQAYWANLKSEEYDVCCQPGKVERCKEPKRKEGLPFCGFPFGSVDHLPAFLPEFQVSLPSGPMRVLQGISDDDLYCTSFNCRVFFGNDLEPRLLWSTALAVYLDLQPKLQGRAIDLGAGVGLTCMVLMRRGADVTCTDVDDAALISSSRNAAAMVADATRQGRLWRYGSLTVLRFNYSSAKEAWRGQGVVPPYDIVAMAASPQGELRKNLATFARLFRELGRSGTHVFLEDQGHREVTCAVPPDLEASLTFAAEGLHLVDIFDPLERGLWPLPRGRIYSLIIA
eukprot:s57_g29.t1